MKIYMVPQYVYVHRSAGCAAIFNNDLGLGITYLQRNPTVRTYGKSQNTMYEYIVTLILLFYAQEIEYEQLVLTKKKKIKTRWIFTTLVGRIWVQYLLAKPKSATLFWKKYFIFSFKDKYMHILFRLFFFVFYFFWAQLRSIIKLRSSIDCGPAVTKAH
jgi:hypothetical protein